MGPKQSKDEIAARREKVQDLEAQGIVSSREIAARLGVSVDTIDRDRKALDALWGKTEAAVELRHRVKRSLIAKAQKRYAELEAEWQRSKKDKEKSVAKEVNPGDGGVGRLETQASTEGRLGDVACMREMRENDRLTAELLDLIKHKHEHSGEGGKAIPVTFVEAVRPDAQ